MERGDFLSMLGIVTVLFMHLIGDEQKMYSNPPWCADVGFACHTFGWFLLLLSITVGLASAYYTVQFGGQCEVTVSTGIAVSGLVLSLFGYGFRYLVNYIPSIDKTSAPNASYWRIIAWFTGFVAYMAASVYLISKQRARVIHR